MRFDLDHQIQAANPRARHEDGASKRIAEAIQRLTAPASIMTNMPDADVNRSNGAEVGAGG